MLSTDPPVNANVMAAPRPGSPVSFFSGHEEDVRVLQPPDVCKRRSLLVVLHPVTRENPRTRVYRSTDASVSRTSGVGKNIIG